MYGKLFASLYQGTLRGRSKEILVFTNLIAHADAYGYVDKHFRAIAEETGLSIEEVKDACALLEAPDPESRSSDMQGARLERIDAHRCWGWRIVNYLKYRAIKNAADRKEQNRAAQSRFREKTRTCADSKQASAIVSISKHASASVSTGKPLSAHAEADAEGDADAEAREGIGAASATNEDDVPF